MGTLLARLSKRSLKADVIWAGVIGLVALGLFVRGEFTRDRTDEIRAQVRETVQQVNEINRKLARQAKAKADVAGERLDETQRVLIDERILERGPQGLRGGPGPAVPGGRGPTGAAGEIGATGGATVGPRGPGGPSGVDGEDAEDGTDGEDGASPTVEQIAQAVANYCAARDQCRGTSGDRGLPGMDSTVPGPAGPPGADSTVPGPPGPQGPPADPIPIVP